jgi:hypothetical protein
VYQGQKVHLSRRSLAEAQPRLENKRGEKALFGEVHINFFRRPHELQSKRHHWKNKFINTYVLTIFYSICYQLANKTRQLLFVIQ